MSPNGNPLHLIRTFNQLVKYLRDELDWPIESDDFEELTFDYAPEELGLDAETAVKVKEIKQLRPLTTRQPWGIFFVNFAPKQLPVVALRRILSTLVIKKRQSANKSQQAAWRLHDLLFISSYGEDAHRDITFAHFAEEHGTGDLPTLRLLGWDDEDTKLKLDFVEHELKSKLHWPEDENDIAAWRTRWSAAFRLRPREVIKTSQQLAIRLAELARSIRKRANNVLAVESDKGPLRKMHAAFKEALIHDLSPDDFADMYAQTISYGLLTARFSRPAGLVADNLADMVPVTNPFLKDLLETFLTIGGRKGKIDFDELGINEVVQLLRDADMEAVLRDFGDRNPQEDPVIHFYELFLKEYDAKKRIQRGVFYTPRPVVSYIVRSVHELLQTEFGLEDGLASTVTWDEMAAKHTGLAIPAGTKPSDPFVCILDPATGTGTFLVEAIDIIHKTMEKRWEKQGHMALEFQNLWNEYVPKHLLPRLHGYELLMAPYAIAHMKIGLKLHETGYRFSSDERARIYLTNSLEPASDDKMQREFEEWVPALAHEARAVNAVKRQQRFTVVIGNPPYARDSKNQSPFIKRLMDRYKLAVRSERNLQPLGDDCIKFFSLAHHIVDTTGVGVLSFISNNKYFSGSTIHRGVREEMASSFARIQITNLNGDVGHPTDRNVFEIREGVGISTLVRLAGALPGKELQYRELFGSTESKYESLMKPDRMPGWIAVPLGRPQFFFVPLSSDNESELTAAVSVASIFGRGLEGDKGTCWGNGVKTNRDELLVADTRDELVQRFALFEDMSLSDSVLAHKLNLLDGPYWKTERERKKLLAVPWREKVVPYCYRPFSNRWILYQTNLMEIGRGGASKHVMKHMLRPNLGLITHRTASKQLDYSHFFAVKTLIDVRTFPDREGVPYLFPLYVYTENGDQHSLDGLEAEERRPNLSAQFLRALATNLKLKTTKPYGLPEGVTPEDIYNYAYAVFHSPGYRTRYAEFLKIDFPRLPLTGNLELFRALARLGGELVALHLLESPKLDKPITTYSGPRTPEIEKISYARGAVWLDREQTCGFKGVPEVVWEFHIGGYQVCAKWLKDRKGRTLSKDDIAHYNKIVVALSETIRLMKKVDEVIDEHGGWPGAFVTDKH